jgi:hypothetical protein
MIAAKAAAIALAAVSLLGWSNSGIGAEGPQTTAAEIVVKKRLPSREVLGTAGTVESVASYPDGTIRILVKGEKLTELSPSTVSLIVSAETEIVSAKDKSRLSPHDLKPGMRVCAFYGPALTRSIPPMGKAEKIVVK